MSSSLADTCPLIVGLGANLPSSIGKPRQTLEALRPQLEKTIRDWLTGAITPEVNGQSLNLRWRWSPLFETWPVGGPPGQPLYLNAVLLVDGPSLSKLIPSETTALRLLEQLQRLEHHFGRDRHVELERWAPRCLDLDLLAWGDFHLKHALLTLPHPRLLERSFVLAPLLTVITNAHDAPRRLHPQPGWPE